MGGRARRKGITAAAVRAARAVAREEDDTAAAIAQRVYNAAHELRTSGEPEVLPVQVMAPLVVAAETVAPGTLKVAGMPVTEAGALEVAAYLVAGFREMAVMFDPAHFERWRQAGNGSGEMVPAAE